MSKNWANDIISFWFEELDVPKDWFNGGESVDRKIVTRFSEVLQQQASHYANHAHNDIISDDVHTVLAKIILFDQFPRNIFRGSAQAFFYDDMALSLAKYAVSHGIDKQAELGKRVFFYLPFEHSENIVDQWDSVRLCAELEKEQQGLLKWAIDHYLIIERFGRFPHRNKVLGRKNTEEEEKYLIDANSYGQ